MGAHPRIYWKILPFVVAGFFIVPIVVVLSSISGPYSDNWQHLVDYVLLDYTFTSLCLVMGVAFLALLIGISTAWVVTNYSFIGKSTFEWALILPLAIPPYILAYTFTGLFDSYGDANNLIRQIFDLGETFTFFPNVRNLPGAIIVFGFTLYPYVYLVTRNSFLNQSRSLREAGRLLGLSQFQVFYKIALPLARPAFIGGLMLVIMETLSDFGAVDHFAVQTFTTGIFRTWYGLYDLDTAMQLSSLLLFVIAVFYFIELRMRKDVKHTTNNSTFTMLAEVDTKGLKALVPFVVCFSPIFIGFVLPITQLIVWAIEANMELLNARFLKTSLNTIILGVSSGLICACLALVLNFSVRLNTGDLLGKIKSLLSIGYALPGLILAVGIMKLFVYLDSQFYSVFEIALTGSLVGLLLAYIIKAYALANSAIESGYTRISTSIDNSAQLLGSSGWRLLRKIHFPLMKASFLTAVLLVISEVVKELPATLVLRPFNFETLAVTTYMYAAEERMYQAAGTSIAIVLIGLIPLIFLTKMIRSSRPD
ncbi:MAG: iron ABC transporter permease [Pseudomonadota bacterium]|nr:iron ABC transporter permease [Pseudomonadota bacterium]